MISKRKSRIFWYEIRNISTDVYPLAKAGFAEARRESQSWIACVQRLLWWPAVGQWPSHSTGPLLVTATAPLIGAWLQCLLPVHAKGTRRRVSVGVAPLGAGDSSQEAGEAVMALQEV